MWYIWKENQLSHITYKCIITEQCAKWDYSESESLQLPGDGLNSQILLQAGETLGSRPRQFHQAFAFQPAVMVVFT